MLYTFFKSAKLPQNAASKCCNGRTAATGLRFEAQQGQIAAVCFAYQKKAASYGTYRTSTRALKFATLSNKANPCVMNIVF